MKKNTKVGVTNNTNIDASNTEKASIVTNSTPDVEKSVKTPKKGLKQPDMKATKELTAEEIQKARDAEIKAKVEAQLIEKKKAKAARRLAIWQQNQKRSAEGKAEKLKKLMFTNNSIPNSNADLKEAAKLKREKRAEKAQAKLLAELKHKSTASMKAKENYRARVKEAEAAIEKKRELKRSLTKEDLLRLAARRTARVEKKDESIVQAKHTKNLILARFIAAQAERNVKRMLKKAEYGKVTKPSVSSTEKIAASKAAKKANKQKELIYKVSKENPTAYTAVLTFVREDGSKFTQKKHWFAANIVSENAEKHALDSLRNKCNAIFKAFEDKNVKRKTLFESVRVYPNYGNAQDVAITSIDVSSVHIKNRFKEMKAEKSKKKMAA